MVKISDQELIDVSTFLFTQTIADPDTWSEKLDKDLLAALEKVYVQVLNQCKAHDFSTHFVTIIAVQKISDIMRKLTCLNESDL